MREAGNTGTVLKLLCDKTGTGKKLPLYSWVMYDILHRQIYIIYSWGYISELLRFAHVCDRYSDFLACHKRLVRTLLDQGFRYGLCKKKFKQFYRSHRSLVQRYSHSVTQHRREGVHSQVHWWRIRILLVGAAVTGTDRLSIYPFFTGVPLAFFSFLFF